MLIRLKVMVNHCQDFQKGVETGNYLVSLGTPGESTLDDTVQRYLGLESRRGFNLYLSGVSMLIYAETSHSGEQWLYAKLKNVRVKAEELLNEAHELDPNNPYCAFHLALINATLGRTPSALAII
jgi:hypothetical protein